MKSSKKPTNGKPIQEINVVNVPIIEIKPPVYPMRLGITDQSIESLVESIKAIGLIHPLWVIRQGKGYEIVTGFRRFNAIKSLGWDFVPVHIMEGGAEQYFQTMSAENYERESITIIDECQFIERLSEELDMKQAQIAKYINKSVSYVNERLAVKTYPEPLINALINETITFSVAREFNKITDTDVLLEYLKFAVENGCTPAIARKWRQQWENQTAHPDTPQLADIADNWDESQQKQTVTQECGACKIVYESHELLPLYVCRNCRQSILSA